MPLTGHNILIVETEIGPFVLSLQRTLEAAGAETLVARDLRTARLRTNEFEFTGVVASNEHAAIKEAVDLRTVCYGSGATERDPRAILAALARLLAAI